MFGQVSELEVEQESLIEIKKIDHEEKYVYAAHDGYMKLKGNPIHSRLWILKDNQLEILDHINGSLCIQYA